MENEASAPPAQYDPAMTRNVAIDYINHKLRLKGYEWTTCPDLPEPTKVNLMMRTLAIELENRYNEVFAEMCTEMPITLSSAYPTFLGVTNELFREGILWGRFVALFSFGGALAVRCMHVEMPHLVDSIVTWVSSYIDNKLAHWLIENGGWDGFVERFDSEGPVDRRRDFEWPSRNFICGVAAGAIGALTIGAFLTSRFI